MAETLKAAVAQRSEDALVTALGNCAEYIRWFVTPGSHKDDINEKMAAFAAIKIIQDALLVYAAEVYSHSRSLRGERHHALATSILKKSNDLKQDYDKAMVRGALVPDLMTGHVLNELLALFEAVHVQAHGS